MRFHATAKVQQVRKRGRRAGSGACLALGGLDGAIKTLKRPATLGEPHLQDVERPSELAVNQQPVPLHHTLAPSHHPSPAVHRADPIAIPERNPKHGS